VRNGRGLTLTPRAESLAPLVSAGLNCFKSAIQETEGFAPDETTRTFTLAAAIIAAHTEHIAAIPLRTAEIFTKMLPLKNCRTEVRIAEYRDRDVWHARTELDDGACYFRQLMLDSRIEKVLAKRSLRNRQCAHRQLTASHLADGSSAT
jgi:DNA-binding transcriptional LysR family regulator